MITILIILLFIFIIELEMHHYNQQILQNKIILQSFIYDQIVFNLNIFFVHGKAIRLTRLLRLGFGRFGS